MGEIESILANYKRVRAIFGAPKRQTPREPQEAKAPRKPKVGSALKRIKKHLSSFEYDILKKTGPLSDSYGAFNNSDHIHLIINETAESCGVSPESLMTNDRSKGVMLARHIACWRVRREVGLSYPKIAALFKRGAGDRAADSFRRIEGKMSLTRNPFEPPPKRKYVRTADNKHIDEGAPRGGGGLQPEGYISKRARSASLSLRRDFRDLVEISKAISDSYLMTASSLDSDTHAGLIIKETAALFDISEQMVTGVRKDPYTTAARHLTFWRMRRELKLSYPQIAAFMGGMDHTTIIYGCARVHSVFEGAT